MNLKGVLSNNYLGTGGSVFASLCCLGTPALLGFVSSIGLGFIINDLILFPLLALFLGISIYSRNLHKKQHKNNYPFLITVVSSILLVPAIFINQYLAYIMIAGLIFASIWDIALKHKCQSCEVEQNVSRRSN